MKQSGKKLKKVCAPSKKKVSQPPNVPESARSQKRMLSARAAASARRHRLIEITADGKLQLHEEGVKALESLPAGPIAVLGIVGEARCGKSFLCNQFVAQAQAGVSDLCVFIDCLHHCVIESRVASARTVT